MLVGLVIWVSAVLGSSFVSQNVSFFKFQQFQLINVCFSTFGSFFYSEESLESEKHRTQFWLQQLLQVKKYISQTTTINILNI
jgi:hypothetical protein